MMVGFRSGAMWDEVGESDLLHAFFSTICFHLESNKWGSKYPYLQNKLYNDKLEPQEVVHALEELKEIESEFFKLSKDDVIWDAFDLSKKAPNSFFAQTNCANLSESFKTVGNKNLIKLLKEILEYCIKKNRGVEIQSSQDLYK